MKSNYKPLWLLFVLLLADQALKIFIKTHMTLGESFHIFNWFQIVFVENPGMAFGVSIGSKYLLTIFRIIIAGIVAYYLFRLMKDNYRKGYIYTIVLVLTGAVGNIIDCMFYGLIFSESTPWQIAQLFPAGGGYTHFLNGKVVDMFYFPLFHFPDWFPVWGGHIFFSPVFNLADSCITVSVFILIIFFRKDFNLTFERYFVKRSQTNG